MTLHKILTLLFILTSHIALGHQDFWRTKDFGNVKVRIKTGFEYEEIKKSWIIGELANKLCQQLNYTNPIFIDFDHYYVGDCEPDYFISFDDGSIRNSWETEKPKPFLKEKALVIREVNSQFKPSTTLTLLEYAIRNANKIKSAQKMIDYDQNYCQWKLRTIDTLEIKRVMTKNRSDLVNNVLSTKVYRQHDDKNKSHISYYFQNNSYHIFYNDYRVEGSALLSLDNVYQFKSISVHEAVIFDTDSSFYFVRGVNHRRTSKRKIIEKTGDNYEPFVVTSVSPYNITFSFWHNDQQERGLSRKRTVLYKSHADELIQNMGNQPDTK